MTASSQRGGNVVACIMLLGWAICNIGSVDLGFGQFTAVTAPSGTTDGMGIPVTPAFGEISTPARFTPTVVD